MVYQAKCNNCRWKQTSAYFEQVVRVSEEHMMEKGHIVVIDEVK